MVGGLVEQQQVGLGGQRPGQRGAGQLAAGEGRERALGAARGRSRARAALRAPGRASGSRRRLRAAAGRPSRRPSSPRRSPSDISPSSRSSSASVSIMSARPEKTYSPSVALRFARRPLVVQGDRERRGGSSASRNRAPARRRAPAAASTCRPRCGRTGSSVRRGSSLKETSSNSSLPPTWTSSEVAVAIAIGTDQLREPPIRRNLTRMGSPLRHLGELARARATRRSSERADGQALSELEARPLELPAGLEVEWLGVSGYRLSYEGRTLFIDPYLSRVPFRDLLRRRPTLPDPAALDRFVNAPGETVGVLVGHTHFDHAVDAPGDRPALRLQGLRLGVPAQPDGPARPRRAGGRGRALPHLRAGPVRGLLHAQRPLEAAARPRRPLRRRTDLRAPRRALARRLPLRPGLGHLDRRRRPALLPPGQRQPRRRGDPRARRRRLPRRRRRPRLHRRLLEADPAPPRPRAPSSPPTTTTSSARSAQQLEFVANVQLAELPDEIGAVSRDIEMAALPRADSRSST